MKISYAISVCNEATELRRLIKLLIEKIRPEDEIIILSDNATYEVKQTIRDFDQYLKWYEGNLNGDFASFKNKLKSYCTGDFVFFIDADEYPSGEIIEILPHLFKENDVDLTSVPRINIVEGIGLSHIQKWGWRIDKLESEIGEKELDLNNPKNLDEYNLLKKYNLIINENKIA